jgi:hypothetical protein
MPELPGAQIPFDVAVSVLLVTSVPVPEIVWPEVNV